MPTSKKRRPKAAKTGSPRRNPGLSRWAEDFPVLAPILASVPRDVAAPIVKLYAELSVDEREYVRAVAELDLVDASAEAAVGIIHHAAAVAPVLHAFIAAQHGERIDEARVYDASSMRDMLRDHWGQGPEHYELHERNRFFYARGAALYVIVKGWKPGREANLHPMDIRLDRHLMWIGSRFEDLKPYAAEILEEGRLDHEFLDEISSRWIPEDKLDMPLDFFMSNFDRVEGYCKHGFHSTVAESKIEQLGEKHGTHAAAAVTGVPVPLLEALHLTSWAPKISEEATAVGQLLAASSPTNVLGHEVFTFLSLLPERILTPMRGALAHYSREDSSMAADRLSILYRRHDPSAQLSEIHLEALARVLAAPVVGAFAAATHEREPFVAPEMDESIDFTREDCESDQQYEERVAEVRREIEEELEGIEADHEAEEDRVFDEHCGIVAQWFEAEALATLEEASEGRALEKDSAFIQLECVRAAGEAIMEDPSWGGEPALHRFIQHLDERGIKVTF